MPGAEVVHTFVATMRPDGEQHRASSRNRLLERRDVCLAGSQAAAVPICRD